MKEQAIVKQIKEYLQSLEDSNKLYFIRNNSGAVVVKNRFIRFGKEGSSDFIIFMPKNRVLFIEIKNESGKQTEKQKEFKNKIVNLGYEYYIVRSVDELINIINA